MSGKKSETKNNACLIGWFKGKWGSNAMFSTCFALVVMILIQCVVLWANSGSVTDLIGRMGVAWMNIMRNNTYQGLIALGMCYIIISGGIDLSVGSMLCALGAILLYLIAPDGLLASMGISGAPAYVIAIAVVVIAGYIFGQINGVLVSYGRIPPFIATLGTMKIFRSVTQQLTMQFNPQVPDGFKLVASARIGGQVILPIIYWVVVVVIMHIIFKRTTFGRQTIAIGSNERASRLSGINVKNVKRRIYALGGVMCAIAAIIYIARIGSMDFSNAGSGYEMDAIAAVIVGGTSMAGGKGTLIGAFLGMLIIGVMNNILNTVGVPTFLVEAVKGLIIIFAVLLQKKDNT